MNASVNAQLEARAIEAIFEIQVRDRGFKLEFSYYRKKVKPLSCVRLFATQWTVDCQGPLSVGFSRQEYRSRFPCPPPGDLLNPGIEPMSLMSLALAGGFFTTSTTWEALQVT